MALIRRFIRAPHANPQWRSETDCGFLIADVDGKRILHLESYGSAERQLRGKGSQFLQIGRERAGELVELLREAFPDLQ